MSQWKSLYLPSDDTATITSCLNDFLVSPQYAPYDPFGLIPGRAYSQAVKLFIAPPGAGWTRIICAADSYIDDDLKRALSQVETCLYCALDDDGVAIEVYRDGEHLDTYEGLIAHTTLPPDQLRAVLDYEGAAGSSSTQSDVPMDVLPDDVRAMADNLNPKQTQRMFNRMSRFVKKDQREAAQNMLNSVTVNWDSPGGTRIANLMHLLPIHDSWRDPDYVALRDAYQLHQRRARKPDARLYPGDAEAMDAVKNALDYTPFFAGVLN